jgi:hypothetical protein
MKLLELVKQIARICSRQNPLEDDASNEETELTVTSPFYAFIAKGDL